jgi:hypothetical protein
MSKINVRRLIEPSELQRDVAFSTTNLDDAMMTQASMAVHYGQVAAAAQKQLDDLKLVLEITEAKVDRHIRDEVAAEAVDDTGKKKLTETQIAKSISLHPQVIAVKKAINEAKQIESEAKTAVEAFRQRRDMLVQIGAGDRLERQGELTFRKREAAEAERVDTIARLNAKLNRVAAT